jgi:hypothetical protein
LLFDFQLLIKFALLFDRTNQRYQGYAPIVIYKIDAPATKMLGLKPLAANVFVLGVKQNAKTFLQRGVSPAILVV